MTRRISRTETRETWPFTRDESAFQHCALRLDSQEVFDSGRSTFVLDSEDGFLVAPLEFELRLEFDPAQVAKVTGVPVEDIDVALVLRNDDAKRHDTLMTWPAVRVPSRPTGSIPPERYGPRRSELMLLAVVNRERHQAAGVAWRRGSLLAERRYSITLPVTASLFRVDFTDFRERGWPEDAVWHVEFRNLETAVDASPEDLVSVHLNANLPLLDRLFRASALRNAKLAPAAALIRPLITAEILFDVCSEVLRTLARLQEGDSGLVLEEIEAETLAGRILSLLTDQLRVGPDKLVEIARDEPLTLKDVVQGLVQVGRAFGQSNLGRMLQ